jgi:hypothetical protein
MGPIQVVVQDGNNLVLEVTPTADTTIILDRGVTGPVGMVWKGNWSNATAYNVNDAVYYAAGNASYICILANTNQLPTNATYWQLLVSGAGNVTGAASSTDNAVVRFNGTTGKLIQNSAVIIADDGSTIINTNSTTNALRITQTGTGNALLVEDSANPDSTPVVIDANGVMVVGTTSAVGGSKLQVADTTSAAAATITAWRGGSSGGGALILNKSRSGTPGTYSIVSAGDTISTIRFSGDDGVGFIAAADIAAYVDGTPGTNDMPGRLVFSTTPDGGSTPVEAMRIGSTGAIGFNSATTLGGASGRFRFGGNITGAVNCSGIFYTPTIQSDVTTAASVFTSQASTVDAAFTLATLSHFQAVQSTITGGSRTAPTNQVGFNVSASLIGATNNFGFQGNIPSGTGRWNLYMGGTADNYLAGNLGIGTTSPGVKLDVQSAGSGNVFRVAGTGSGAYVTNVFENLNAGGYAQHLFNVGAGGASGQAQIGYAPGIFFAIGPTANDTTTPIVFRNNNATERMRLDVSGNLQVLTGANVVWAPAPAAISAATTLTNANIQAQIINTTGTSYTVTMPLGTTMETLVPWAAVNLGYDFRVINTASGTITIAVNTGVTSLGGLTIATGVSAEFRIRRTAANTFILYRLG